MPRTQYARSGNVHIAYQVLGTGPLDLVFVPGYASHLELQWEEPMQARFFRRLASFARLVRFDKRGAGLSDRVASGNLEQRMDDVRAVMDAAGCQRAALFGLSEGGPLSLVFAATHPRRTTALILWNSFSRYTQGDDYPLGRSADDRAALIQWLDQNWGTGQTAAHFVASAAHDPRFTAWWDRFERAAFSPGGAVDHLRWCSSIDARSALPAIHVPTLVLHMVEDADMPPSAGRYIAERIEGARMIEMPGADHFAWPSGDAVADEVEQFLTGSRRDVVLDRVLATLMFTDIVDSTGHAIRLGDRDWRDLLHRHHDMVREELARWRGQEVDTAGDGFFATFDGPARAVRCACAVRERAHRLGLDVKAGLHTGEVAFAGRKAEGIAVHIAARVAATAPPGEVWVSSTVKDLTAGAGLALEDRGLHGLRGVPGQWQLYCASA